MHKSTQWLLCLCLLFPATGWGQAAVVVNIANASEGLSKTQLANIYMGKTASWKSEQNIIYPIALTFKNPTSQRFFVEGLGKRKRDLQKAWLKLALSGASKPPKVVSSDRDILEYVAKNRGALGFVGLQAFDPEEHQDVRLIKIEGKLPTEAGYLFD